jgi:hypothetical protein
MDAMKTEGLYYLAAAILSVAWLLSPGLTHARSRNLSINFEDDSDKCSDLKVRSTGTVAQAAESFILRKGDAPLLEVDGADRGQIRVRGWDRQEYSVEACKVAVADDRAGADRLLNGISVSRGAGRFSSSGPGGDAGEWLVVFIVHAPKDSSLDLETKNGPIDVRDLSGTLKVRAVNGRVSISNSTGNLEAHTANGPIALSGGGGDVHLNARNGPIAVKLSGAAWNGAQLEARTINGPLAVSLPNTFRSGVRLETSGHAPISCRAEACRHAWIDAGRGQRTLQLNGSGDTVRLSTENGPVSVSGLAKSARII